MQLVMFSVQSASVKRVCKSHNIIHIRTRNKLNMHTLHMLLCAYVSLCLPNKCCAKLGDFLTQCIDQLEVTTDENGVE